MKNLSRFDTPVGRVYTESYDAFKQGDFYVSVTTILEVAVPKKLTDYMKKNSAASQEKRLQETADIGSRIHKLIELDLKGEEVIPDPDCAAAFDKWSTLRHEHNIEATETEQLVYSELGYAGTADIIGTFDDKPALMDIKTGWYGVKAGWQMAAYREAWMSLKNIEELGLVGIQIKRDGSTGKPFVYEHYDFCFNRFLDCLGIFKGLYYNQLAKMNWKFLNKEAR